MDKEKLFWFLYMLGGALYLASIFVVKSRQKSNQYIGKRSFPRTFKIIISSSALWVFVWLIGFFMNYNKFNLFMGLLPVGLTSVTAGSLTVIKLQDRHLRNKKKMVGRTYIEPFINDWLEEYAEGKFNLEKYTTNLLIRGDNVNGRVILYVNSENNNLDWNFLINALSEKINQPIIFEIKKTNKVFPSLLPEHKDNETQDHV